MTEKLQFLTRDEERALLKVARLAVAAHLESRPPARKDDLSSRLQAPRGAFVSLHQGQELRGCVGTISTDRPLIETVATCAVAAATEDPRFDPLTPDELSTTLFEISVLDTPFRIEEPSRIVLGTHGLVITQGVRRGVLLPQVAVAQGWDVLTFLEESCRKAGLTRGAWKHEALVEAFSAQVFSEADPPSY
jgi:uncharacterized protein